jgi:hypothetical protein
MQTSDRPEFDAQLARLCAAYNVPATPERLDGYWTAFRNLSLLEFARIIEAALGEQGPERMPTVPALWGIRKALRVKPPHMLQERRDVDPWPMAANRLLVAYLWRRRLNEGHSGDISLAARVAATSSLAEFFSGLHAERDPEATFAELARRFDGAMARIADAPH